MCSGDTPPFGGVGKNVRPIRPIGKLCGGDPGLHAASALGDAFRIAQGRNPASKPRTPDPPRIPGYYNHGPATSNFLRRHDSLRRSLSPPPRYPESPRRPSRPVVLPVWRIRCGLCLLWLVLWRELLRRVRDASGLPQVRQMQVPVVQHPRRLRIVRMADGGAALVTGTRAAGGAGRSIAGTATSTGWTS